MLSDPSHPLWKLARQAVVGSLLLLFLTINYKHGLVPEKDVWTVASVMLGLFGFDLTKAQITKPKTDSTEQDHAT